MSGSKRDETFQYACRGWSRSYRASCIGLDPAHCGAIAHPHARRPRPQLGL